MYYNLIKDTSRQPDYKKQVTEELDQIESRIILLNDMLNQKKPSEMLVKDTALESLYTAAKAAQIKLRNFIENNEDEDRLGRLLELNDLINTVLNKHDNLKSGKSVKDLAIDRKASSAQDKSPIQPGLINLIDFDDGPATKSSPVNFMDSFGGISFVTLFDLESIRTWLQQRCGPQSSQTSLAHLDALESCSTECQ